MSWLTGWKQIGAYLGVSVTTVIRYHKDHGLPVHRCPMGPPAALPDEINSWLKAGFKPERKKEAEPDDLGIPDFLK